MESDHGHEAVCALQFVEESVELVQGQLSKDCLLLVPLVEQLHLQQNHALARICTHAIGRSNYTEHPETKGQDFSSPNNPSPHDHVSFTYLQTCSRS